MSMKKYEVGPAILYKYLPPERIDILECMELRFSSPFDFNDTFDTHYLVPGAVGLQASSDRTHLKHRLGIVCLTELPDNHLMWVHYARNHTGFVIGFDTTVPFFSEDDRILRKVHYQRHPNVLPYAGIDACFLKSIDWSDEREWRCAREFNQSESRDVEIPGRLVSQIIFGWKMEDWQIARIVLYLTAHDMTHVRFFKSSPAHKTWTFENKPKKMIFCNHCGGDGYLMEDSKPEDV